MKQMEDDVSRLIQNFGRFSHFIKRRSRNADLRTGEIAILRCIMHHTDGPDGEIKPSQISALMGLQQPSITPSLRSLEERGYVEKTFTEAVQAREREYPTGLRTFPFSIAIPHADSVYTKREAVVVVRPEQPIHFREMATVDQYVDAELIFLLLLKKDNAHAEFLEVLLEMTQQEEFMIGIMQAQDAKEAFGLLEKYFNAH